MIKNHLKTIKKAPFSGARKSLRVPEGAPNATRGEYSPRVAFFVSSGRNEAEGEVDPIGSTIHNLIRIPNGVAFYFTLSSKNGNIIFMNNEIKIRNAEISDIESLDCLLYQVQKVHSDARPDLFVAGTKKYTDEQLKQILKDETKPIFVATENGTVLGYAFCILLNNRESNTLTAIKTLYIDDLCVDKTCRGKGIGKLLYDYVIKFAKKRGCYNVTLNVWADNKNAVTFYEKIGLQIQKIGMEKIL